MTSQENCQIVTLARELCKQLKAEEVPATFIPYGGRNPAIATIRHSYTNYEQLLDELRDWCKSHFRANCDQYDTEQDCPFYEQAHDILKWAARDIAEQAYHDWKAEHNSR